MAVSATNLSIPITRQALRQSHPFRSRRAFTLIELLVVLAIIGILASLLFPAFSRARENGRRASCQSNLRQIGLSLLQYSQDYDEMLVADWYGPLPNSATDPASTPNSRYKWMDAIYPYVKSEAIFDCPSDQESDDKFTYYGNLTAPTTKFSSYVIVHGYGPQQSSGYTNRHPPVSHPYSDELVSMSMLATPSTTSWVMDGRHNFYLDCLSADIIPGSPRHMNYAEERHLNTLNVLFCDGHVKALKFETLSSRGYNGVLRYFTVEDD